MRKHNRASTLEIGAKISALPVSNFASPVWHRILLVVAAFFVYCNSLDCGFVFDDASAIVDNQDLRSHIHPWWILFKNDFWGTPMSYESSHKSYRPLTVLTYRWNYILAELDPWGFHLVNVLLHTITVLLFHHLSTRFIEPPGSLAASLLFAVHPIHVEAVTGIVGRAELLSAIFVFISLLIYLDIIKSESVKLLSEEVYIYSHDNDELYFYSVFVIFVELPRLLAISILVIIGTLCKEQCITVVGVCLAYDFVFHFIHTFYTKSLTNRRRVWIRFVFRLTVLAFTSALFLMVRVKVMGSQLPHFTSFDNPAAHASPMTRRLTHLYLIFVNLALLFYPSGLCADWTMGSIRLIKSFSDWRNACTLFAFLGLFLVALRCASPWTKTRQALTLSMAGGLALLGLPFLPASNLFFYVGFVVAERVLYVPSAGFCLIMGLGFQFLLQRCSSKRKRASLTKMQAYLVLAVICSGFALKTFYRNYDW
ncbi:unnamed protein product [Hymenolepis diminuta]|uniref:DUF1736 domain-containing protein n=1 Tax=Hymenolepis diminuta TaxID=6216 RepID=A0A158QE01_HYMDI|nr:unnamed protein product [Hymenolepis diminuta]